MILSWYLVALVLGFLVAYAVSWSPNLFRFRLPVRTKLVVALLSVTLALVISLGLNFELANGARSAPEQFAVLSGLSSIGVTAIATILSARSRRKLGK
ncbi:MAG TPA: hypothetical protein PKH39_13540 [Woeseiaceae bacterium]|nr:hypothetical protein [Woeseiaceae bacterium]